MLENDYSKKIKREFYQTLINKPCTSCGYTNHTDSSSPLCVRNRFQNPYVVENKIELEVNK